MFSKTFSPFHVTFFFFLVMLSIVLLYQAWENIINKRFSNYSLDGLIVFLSNKFANLEIRARIHQASKDKKRLLILGLFSFLASVKGFMSAYSWMMKYLIK